MPAYTSIRRVAFRDTDAAGIVHFSQFFVWMEDCEHAFLRSLGTSVHALDDEGQRLFPRVSATCDYHRPFRFEDEVAIALDVVELREKVVRYAFTFRRVGSDEVHAEGATTVVFARATADGMRAAPFPHPLAQALRAALVNPDPTR